MSRGIGVHICLRCGGTLPEGSGQSRKYCDACGKARNIELTIERQQKAAKKQKTVAEEKQEIADRRYCRSCKFYGSENYGRNLCDFLLITGRRRGCKCGVGCERREIKVENNA